METIDHWLVAFGVTGALLLTAVLHEAYVRNNQNTWYAEALAERRACEDKNSETDTLQHLRLAAVIKAAQSRETARPVGGQIHQPSPARVQALRAALQAQAFVRTNILPYDLRRKACISRAHGK